MKTKNTFKKTLSGLALLSALTFGYNANAQDITPTKVSTETNLQQTSVRDGVQLQRTEIDWDNVTVKYDAKSNLNPSVSKDNLSDVGGIYIDKLFGGPHYSVGGSVTQLGNWDDKSQAIFDGYVNLDYDKWKASFEKGHSIRNTAPMEFDIANVKFNSDDIRAKAEAYFVSNNGSMYNGEEKQSYEYVLLGNKNLSAAYAEANGVSHVLSTVNLNNKFGSFVWAYADRSKRNWAVRSRMALGETQEDTKGEDEENFRLEHDVTGIDEKYFDYGMNETALDGLIMPALYDMHLSPGIIRGKYSFSTTILANGKNTSIELLPGMKAGSLKLGKHSTIDGYIGLGTYTEMNNKTMNTGVSVAAFSNISIGKFKASIDAAYRGAYTSVAAPAVHRNDVTVYLKTCYTP